MPVLFTYRMTHDTGFAPNPYWGICTLATCKPIIRRAAKVGDWIAGIGSAVAKCAAVRNRLIFAMKVSGKMSLREYDAFALRNLRGKIPRMRSRDLRKRVGDSIFDFSTDSPKPRPSRHCGNKEALRKDLKGKFALLSDHFFYFGEKAISIPDALLPIIPYRGHRSKSNAPYFSSFSAWMRRLKYEPNIIHGKPSSAVYQVCLTPEPIYHSENTVRRGKCRHWH